MPSLHVADASHDANFRDCRPAAESQEGTPAMPSGRVRYRDISPEAWRRKVANVVSVMEKRMANSVPPGRTRPRRQTYTVHDFHPVSPMPWSDAARRRARPHLALRRGRR